MYDSGDMLQGSHVTDLFYNRCYTFIPCLLSIELCHIAILGQVIYNHEILVICEPVRMMHASGLFHGNPERGSNGKKKLKICGAGGGGGLCEKLKYVGVVTQNNMRWGVFKKKKMSWGSAKFSIPPSGSKME